MGKGECFRIFRIVFKSLEAFAFTRLCSVAPYTTFISESCVFLTVMLPLVVLMGPMS